ncbi:hypothetical protein VTO73DRAFT_7037 [Trametes versicolor]
MRRRVLSGAGRAIARYDASSTCGAYLIGSRLKQDAPASQPGLMRTPATEPALVGDDTLPDLSQLAISPSVSSSVLFGDEDNDFLPVSPRPPLSPLPDTLLPHPVFAQGLRPGGESTPARGVTVNITVHAAHASVAVNTATRTGEVRTPRYRRRTAVARTPTGTSTTSGSGVHAQPTPPVTTTKTQEYTLRGGGKVIAWNPALEHIEPRDARHSRRWYVVTAGLRVGIWKSWLAMEDYIDVPGKRYQSYEHRDEAEKDYYEAKRDGRVRLLIK